MLSKRAFENSNSERGSILVEAALALPILIAIYFTYAETMSYLKNKQFLVDAVGYVGTQYAYDAPGLSEDTGIYKKGPGCDAQVTGSGRPIAHELIRDKIISRLRDHAKRNADFKLDENTICIETQLLAKPEDPGDLRLFRIKATFDFQYNITKFFTGAKVEHEMFFTYIL